MLVLGRVAAMIGHDQRQAEAPGDRQGKSTTPAEMGMDQARCQRPQIGRWRQDAELLEERAVEPAQHAVATEDGRLDTQIAQALVQAAANPARYKLLETDIEPPQELRLGPRHDAVAIDQHGTDGHGPRLS